jgi:O-methyltransferase involved in polyketide biosynthesis
MPLRQKKAGLMSKKRFKIGHSKTALLTAFYRALGNKEFQNQKFGSDDLAEYFLPFYVRFLIKNKKMRTKVKDKYQIRMPGVFEYVMARTAFFDEVFIDDDIELKFPFIHTFP